MMGSPHLGGVNVAFLQRHDDGGWKDLLVAHVLIGKPVPTPDQVEGMLFRGMR
jgi:hypothetical protein